MKISRRHGVKWVKQENADKHYCDECKKQLWQAPDGKTKYCNTQNCGTDYAWSTDQAHISELADSPV